MAITHNEVQITWAAANSKAVTTATAAESDVVTMDTTAVDATLHLKASHGATPGAGDDLQWYIKYTGGDPDGTGADEYDSNNYAQLLAVVELDVDDPALISVPINPAVKAFKLRAYNAAGETITVSATMTEVRG